MEKDDLIKEVERGRRANDAYENHLKDHINAVRSQLFTAFCGPDVPSEDLVKIKGLASAINGLEMTIFADIENAKLAAKQLNDLNN